MNPKFSRQVLLENTPSRNAYFPYCFVGNSGISIAFSMLHCAVNSFVQVVISWSIPTKIRNAIICRDAIIVTRLHAYWLWLTESFKDYFVNRPLSYFSIITKRRNKIPSVNRWMKFYPRPAKSYPSSASLSATPHASIVPDSVAGKVFDWTIFGWLGNFFIRHAVLLRRTLCLDADRASTLSAFAF